MIEIKEEFRNLIPALSAEEYAQLEANILNEGIREPIITWNGFIIDGHNRYSIAQRFDLEYKTTSKHFESEQSVKEWMILNQFGRRNLSKYQRSVLALQLEEVFIKKAKENIVIENKNRSTDSAKLPKRDSVDTRKELSIVAQVGERTLGMVKKIQEKAPEEVKAKLATGEVSINAAYKEIKKEEKKEQKEKKIQEIKANSINYKQSNVKLLEGDLFNEIKKIEDNTIDVLNTDPPYFVLEDSWDTFKNLDEFLSFTENWLKAVKPKLKKTARVYISFAPDYKFHLYKILEKLNFLDLTFGNEIIWVKRNNNKLFKQVRYRLTYESIIYLYGNKNKLNFTSDTYGETQTDVWEIATPQSNFNEGKYHSAQKPLELYKRIIKTAASNGETVLDCFAGSGTTGIICKELNINCILIEKDIENIKIIKGRL
jgi:DNA modification methylase